MIRRTLTLLALLAAATALAATAAHAAAPRASLSDVEDEVMCITCGTALNISQAPSADRERAFIRRQIAQGRTKAQVKAALVDEYGPNVLATPPDRGFGRAAWLVPLLLALLAATAIALTVGRWRRAGALTRDDPDTEAAADPDEPELDPDDARRLARDMAAYDR